MKGLNLTPRIFGRVLRARRGQSLVEFAMVAPLFFLLVFGIIDFGRLFFTQLTLQYALREAGRYAVTGQHQPIDPSNPAAGNYTREQSIRNIAQKYAAGLLPNSSAIDIKAYDSQGKPDTAYPAGLPNETVVVSLKGSLQFITPVIGDFFPKDSNGNRVYDFTVSTSFKNEPFDSSDAL
ncbi:MAG TPA: TadE/TadG family type IV pilus assembly protein [Verrucomicrobiae bacterium]|nr:TadE/TadG family type IV pilus assembly protein [Verrucomicrobiae bacterium]